MKTINRITQLVKILLSQDSFVTIQKLSNEINVSERTIHNYISSQKFKELIFPATLKKTPNKGIKLNYNESSKLTINAKLKQTSNMNYEKENDYFRIMIKLFSTKEKISYKSFCDELYISTTTLKQRLDEIEHYVSKYNCTIKDSTSGIFLSGDEISIRKVFNDFLTNFLTEKNSSQQNHSRLSKDAKLALDKILDQDEISKLIEIINVSEGIINTNYCNADYNRLIVQLAILIFRTRHGFYAQEQAPLTPENSQEFYYSILLKNYLEKDFTIQLPQSETSYLSSLLASTRKQINVASMNSDTIMLEKFINLLSVRLNVDLSNDLELKQNLISHLKPAINRMKFGVVNENPLLEHTRINYTEIYMAVITTIEDLEIIENIYFDSNEIGYICLHIIAAINRPFNKRRIKTALICNEGLSIEIFLKNIIESYFSEILVTEIFRENDMHTIDQSQFNLIVNSSNQTLKADNVIPISTSFTHSDYNLIRHSLLYKGSTTHKQTKNTYENYLLFFNDTVKNQDELIKKYCTLLEQKHYVNKEYYNSVLARTKISSTYIARGIALPHGAKDTVLSSKILIINLSKSIKWDDEEADLIILVAANDKDSKNYNSLFRKIMKIASNDLNSSQLKKCKNIEDIRQLLEII